MYIHVQYKCHILATYIIYLHRLERRRMLHLEADRWMVRFSYKQGLNGLVISGEKNFRQPAPQERIQDFP